MLYFVFLQTALAYDATLSLGNLCEYVGKIQTDDSGSTNFCSFNPFLAASYEVPLYSSGLIFAPEIGFTAPKSGRDENISKMAFFALVNTKYKFSTFHMIGGLGFFITRITGSGGTETLNNGTGSSSFPLPSGSSYARNFIVNLGLGMEFNKEWSADLHTFIFNLSSSDDRAFSIALNGTYHFGEF
jgi:hypothetical protein